MSDQVVKKPKVLFIEDDEFLGQLLIRFLRKKGWEFKIALDGESGLELARSFAPDIIVLDLVLPGVDGYETLRRLKADSELRNIPVLILSNLGQKAEVERGLKLGAVDFLIKAHFDIDEILVQIEKYL